MRVAVFDDGRCIAGNTVGELKKATKDIGASENNVMTIFSLSGVYLPDDNIYTVLEQREYEDGESYLNITIFASRELASTAMQKEAEMCLEKERDAEYIKTDDEITVIAGSHTYRWRLEAHPVVAY